MKVDTVLFFQTSPATPSREKIAGVFRYIDSSDWSVQLVEINLKAGDVREAMHKWNPVGCIVDRGLASGRTPIRLMNGMPAVFIDQNPLTAVSGHWYVRNDSAAVVRSAFAELRRLKPAHYAFVRQERQTFWNREREEAFRKIARREHLPFTILNDNLELTRALAELPKRCGLLAVNDTTARNVIHAARQADISLPGDLHVVGINNDAFICQHTKPTLSSVRLDFEEAGYLAMATLHRIVRGSTAVPRTILFGPKELIRRDSTRIFAKADPRVTRALDYIAANASDPYITTDRIAAAMGCSRSLANLLFGKVTGHSIRDEIRQRRIETAKRLLTDKTRELSAIPSLCGYLSLTTFARTFKAETGMTMLGWRKANAAM